MKKFAAGAMARGAVAGKDLKDRMHAKFESAGKQGGTGFSMADKVLQQTGLSSGGAGGGGGGGGAGGSSGAYGRTGQDSKGNSLSSSSNPNFKTATKTDEKTLQQRSMTNKEYQDEKKQHGSSVGQKVGEWLNNHSQQKVDSGQGSTELPENLTDNIRQS